MNDSRNHLRAFHRYLRYVKKTQQETLYYHNGISTFDLVSAASYARTASYASSSSIATGSPYSGFYYAVSHFITKDIKFRLTVYELTKSIYELRCIGVVVNDGEVFHKKNTPDEDAFEELRVTFNDKLYPALTKVRDAIYSSQEAIENGKDVTFRKACEIFEEACNDLNDLREKVDLSIVFAKKSNRPIHKNLVPRSDATAKVAIMCESVFIHFKNAYTALISLNIATDAYNAAKQQSKEAIAELPSDFAGTWEMFTVN